MCAPLCVYMHICIHVYANVYVVFVHICIHVCAPVHVCLSVCTTRQLNRFVTDKSQILKDSVGGGGATNLSINK